MELDIAVEALAEIERKTQQAKQDLRHNEYYGEPCLIKGNISHETGEGIYQVRGKSFSIKPK